jgi:hypothetical protein
MSVRYPETRNKIPLSDCDGHWLAYFAVSPQDHCKCAVNVFGVALYCTNALRLKSPAFFSNAYALSCQAGCVLRPPILQYQCRSHQPALLGGDNNIGSIAAHQPTPSRLPAMSIRSMVIYQRDSSARLLCPIVLCPMVGTTPQSLCRKQRKPERSWQKPERLQHDGSL